MGMGKVREKKQFLEKHPCPIYRIPFCQQGSWGDSTAPLHVKLCFGTSAQRGAEAVATSSRRHQQIGFACFLWTD